MQEVPSTAERFKDKYAQNKETPIKGVRMGAGERSYLVRDDHIDVLKNVYGGVQVCPHNASLRMQNTLPEEMS